MQKPGTVICFGWFLMKNGNNIVIDNFYGYKKVC